MPMNVPRATYRVQFNSEFTFHDAANLTPYLARLGVSHIYASPIFTARSGSTHGYDVADPLRLNPELGGDAGFDHLIQQAHAHDLRLILDIVPNHMAAHPDNPWWRSVLEIGQHSPHARIFDIDWDPGRTSLPGKVLLPTLGAPFGEVLERGELRLGIDERGIAVRYFDNRLPIDPATYNQILEPARAALKSRHSAVEEDCREVERLISNVRGLAMRVPRPDSSEALVHEREEFNAWLWRDYNDYAALRQAVDQSIDEINGDPEHPGSFDRLERLLDAQHYRLAWWRTASDQINYRRFFDIADLVSVRIEDPDVLQTTHRLIIELAASGRVDGFRVDHVDGLRDPVTYLERFQQIIGADESGQGTYVLVEKILTGDERLPSGWPVSGTTGYEFADRVNNVLVDADGFERIRRNYVELTGIDSSFERVVHDRKRRMLDDLFAGDLSRLVSGLVALADQDRDARDFSPHDLEAALREVTVRFPVYRSYTRGRRVSGADHRHIVAALESAANRDTDLNPAALSFLGRALTLALGQSGSDHQDDRDSIADDLLAWVMSWQQLTGPLMAKGLEDTALYVYTPLLSLNEVGGEPAPITVRDFHAHNQHISEQWPHTMLATSTHDTKRSEDVRARIAVLSEFSGEWVEHLDRWRAMNSAARRSIDGRDVPDANEEQFIYQTLIGAWPLDDGGLPAFRDRVKEYLVKAMREAKEHTHWIDIDEEHEGAVLEFVDDILDGDRAREFLGSFLPFQRRVAGYGVWNSLSQLTLRLSAPGVPDTYRGTELWDFSLADPDNRRPVDFSHRAHVLDRVERATAGDWPDMVASWMDGRIKLACLHRALLLRAEWPDLFRDGAYLPVDVEGPGSRHVIAFCRHLDDRWTLTVVPRLVAGIAADGDAPVGEPVWGDTALVVPAGAPERWTNAITGAGIDAVATGDMSRLRLSEVLPVLPVAILQGTP